MRFLRVKAKSASGVFLLLIPLHLKRIFTWNKEALSDRDEAAQRPKMVYCILLLKQNSRIHFQPLISIMECKLKLNNHNPIELWNSVNWHSTSSLNLSIIRKCQSHSFWLDSKCFRGYRISKWNCNCWSGSNLIFIALNRRLIVHVSNS